MTLLPLVVAIRPAGKMEKNLLHADGLSLPPPLLSPPVIRVQRCAWAREVELKVDNLITIGIRLIFDRDEYIVVTILELGI